MNETSFVYVCLIETTPREVWRALTDSGFIAQYFDNSGPRSDWQVGSRVEWCIEPGGRYHDWGQRVLESIPERRLSYSWYNYEPEMAKFFPEWNNDRLADLRREPVSTVTFDIDPLGPRSTKLTLVHDGFVEKSRMLEGIRQGWPEILSKLKLLLEPDEEQLLRLSRNFSGCPKAIVASPGGYDSRKHLRGPQSTVVAFLRLRAIAHSAHRYLALWAAPHRDCSHSVSRRTSLCAAQIAGTLAEAGRMTRSSTSCSDSLWPRCVDVRRARRWTSGVRYKASSSIYKLLEADIRTAGRPR